MSILSLQSLSLDYAEAGTRQKRRVLDGINLHIASDEFVIVIGRSGSGKTSLLNLAAGFTEPSEGRVSVDGKEIDGPGADRAVVFQDDALYPWLSAVGNVAFPLKLQGIARAERQSHAEELLAKVGLEGAGHKNIWELSGGMRQRVGIARALASGPRFLLLDEPLGALDALTRSRMQKFLLEVWAGSKTSALLITHSIDEALLLATRVIVLAPNPGRIVADVRTEFGKALLDGKSVKEIKMFAAFKSLHDELTALIHGDEEEIAA
ncbi:taurine transport system ATP-binding protein [Rhizobium sp. BK529]|uniref:taurine ABC transporter ATP-binding protein n=1 Tax=unclassified Rhizobium TaxID=2613769 RepID=UPI001044A5B7|nr:MULTISPECIES: ABC transporter ATP-binding protein [unclassified Rhizobium]MBB3593436.1 taurine transport system ATP-binding protein [Rhizobium sp. BK529]TCS03231.1 taurine transport system ATP-binding protein [Rhizobium sp. BK418]